MTRFATGVFVVLFLCAAGTVKDEKIPLKFKDPAKGDAEQIDRVEKEVVVIVVKDDQGKELKKEEIETSREFRFKTTYVEPLDKDGQVTKVKREYEKAQRSLGGKTEKLPYQGKAVIIEKKDGKYQFTLEGNDKPLSEKDAEDLDKEFNTEDKTTRKDLLKMVFPKDQVCVDETWKVDPKFLIDSIEKGSKNTIAVDAAKATATGKLVKVVERDGKKFGEFEFKMELPMKKGGIPLDPNVTAEFEPGTKIVMTAKQESCIDGSSLDDLDNSTTTLKGDATATLPGGTELKLEFSLKQDRKSTSKDVTKK